MAKVELKKVNKIYPPAVHAVHDTDITIEDREFVVFVGPSGCGKSTTLRMIAGLEEITNGELYIDGRLMNNVPAKSRDIAMVFQNYALYPHMSVYDNMAFGLKIKKVPKAEIRKRVQSAAEILNIESLLDRKPRALSGGQRQRVAVGRAIVREPKVFLFDEPLSNLDAKLRVQMRTEISALHNRLGATMIYVTHDQVEAMTMGDKIVVMKDGHIQQIGAPAELYNAPGNLFVAGFIGSPPMNLFGGRLRREGEDVVFAGDGFALRAAPGHAALLRAHDGLETVLGVRAEDFFFNVEGGSADCVPATVSLAEFLGSEVHVYALDRSGRRIVASADASSRFGTGETVRLHPDMAKAHYFDAKTEASLLR